MARQELTLKQRKFIKAYIDGGSLSEAAEKAGYKCTSPESFQQVGFQNLRKLNTKINGIMMEMGLDNPKLLKKLDQGLNAFVVETAKYQGKILDEKKFVDFPTRSRYLEMAFKLNGAYAPDKHEHTGKDGAPIETKSTTEIGLAKRLMNDEGANKLVHALLDHFCNPGGNGHAIESGTVGAGPSPGTSEPKAG